MGTRSESFGLDPVLSQERRPVSPLSIPIAPARTGRIPTMQHARCAFFPVSPLPANFAWQACARPGLSLIGGRNLLRHPSLAPVWQNGLSHRWLGLDPPACCWSGWSGLGLRHQAQRLFALCPGRRVRLGLPVRASKAVPAGPWRKSGRGPGWLAARLPILRSPARRRPPPPWLRLCDGVQSPFTPCCMP